MHWVVDHKSETTSLHVKASYRALILGTILSTIAVQLAVPVTQNASIDCRP